MKNLLTIITMNCILFGVSFGQAHDEEALLEGLIDKNIKTSTYHSVEFNKEGEELSESIGYSDDKWELEELDGNIILTLTNKGELMETYDITNYEVSEEGILFLYSSKVNISFWFYDEYLLMESHSDTNEEVSELLGRNYTWFYYN